MNEGQGETRDRMLQTRTRAFALRVIRLYSALSMDTAVQVLGKQLLRSGTSVGAHYAEGSRARSGAEFISKSLSENRRGLARIVESTEQFVPVPLSWTVFG